jgi:hypothetical protein
MTLHALLELLDALYWTPTAQVGQTGLFSSSSFTGTTGAVDSSFAAHAPLKTDVIDVDMSRTSEEGAHSPSWPNGLVLLLLHHAPLAPTSC